MKTYLRAAVVAVAGFCAIFDAAAQERPELYVASGHSTEIFGGQFSPDGKLLLTSNSEELIIWDTTTGEELRRFKNSFYSFGVLGANGLFLLQTAADTVSLLDLPNGRTIGSFKLEAGCGLILARLWRADRVAVWTCRNVLVLELPTLRVLSRVKQPEFDAASLVQMTATADGRALAFSDGKSVSVLETATGKLVRRFEIGREIYSIASTSSGREIICHHATGVDALDPESGTQRTVLALETRQLTWSNTSYHVHPLSEDRFAVVDFVQSRISYYDIATGNRTFTTEYPPNLSSRVIISMDGSKFGHHSATGAVRIANAGENFTFAEPAKTFITKAIAFGSDLRTFATSAYVDVNVWNLAGRPSVSSFRRQFAEGSLLGLNSLAFFRDDALTLLSEAYSFQEKRFDYRLVKWSETDGFVDLSLNDPEYAGQGNALSPDGSRFATFGYREGSPNRTVRIRDAADGTTKTLFELTQSIVRALSFSGNGTAVAATGARFGSESPMLWVLRSDPKSVKEFDLQSYFRPGAPEQYIRTTVLDETGDRAAYTFGVDENGTYANGYRAIDTISGREVQTEKLDPSCALPEIAFAPGGRQLVVVCNDGAVWLHDLGRPNAARKIHTAPQRLTTSAFSRDGKVLAVGGYGGRVTLLDFPSGREFLSVVQMRDGDWLAATPDGLFDGSPTAIKNIRWRFSPQLYDLLPAEAFFNDYYYPGLIAEVLAGERPKAPSEISARDRRQPQLVVRTGSVTADAGRADLRIEIAGAPAGARDLRLFRNGSLVKAWRGDLLAGRVSAAFDVSVTLVAGENRFTAYAFNRDNVKSRDAEIVVNGAPALARRGTAYVLAIGVNAYENPEYNLSYASVDAKRFAADFKTGQDKAGNFERTETVLITDSQATKQGILNAIGEIGRKARPEDAVVVFFAGHGTAYRNRFYLIPHDLGYRGSRSRLDEAGLGTILTRSISDEELERALEPIDAAQTLMVLDSCNSGQALEAEEKRRGPMNSRGLAQLAYEKGMYILTASQSYQLATESSRLGHGFLSYALLENGLREGRADRGPSDGKILLREWLDYAVERVPGLFNTEGERRRQLEREKGKTAPKTESPQIPRVFYRREPDRSPWVIAVR